MNTQFLTCVFKLHDPSRWRRDVLDYAFEEYTLTLDKLLSWCRDNLEMIRIEGKYEKRDKYSDKSIMAVLPKSSEIDCALASSTKEALVNNAASMLASFFELERSDEMETVSFPTARDPDPQGYPNALSNFASVGASEDDYAQAKDRLMKRSRSSVMPIHFTRRRDFALLFDPIGNRWFVWLKLLPAHHKLGKSAGMTDGNLLNLNDGMKPKTYNGTSAILVPLQVGRRHDDWYWQYEKFLLPTIAQQAIPRSAKLLRDDDAGEYYLHVAFEFECEEEYEPKTYLGIDRGILYTAAYAVVDDNGKVLFKTHQEDGLRNLQIELGEKRSEKQHKGCKVTYRDFQRRQQEMMLHMLVNDIIDVAHDHKAQIVLEDLNIQVAGKYVRSVWAKLERILKYKCNLAGVPFRGGVFAAKTSQICIHCGEIVERDDRVLICHYCGSVEHSDEAAAVNIARRAMYRKAEWDNYRQFHRSFSVHANGSSDRPVQLALAI